MATTPNLALPLLAAAQSQKHVTHNAALILLDAMAQCAVQSIGVNTPPPSANAGDRYVIGTAPTGAFSSAANQFAIYDGYAWQFVPIKTGNLVFNFSDKQFWFYDGTLWRHLHDPSQLPRSYDTLAIANLTTTNLTTSKFGIGTAPDANNTLAVKINSGLFTALASTEGGSGQLRLTLNKQASGNSVSHLYQSNYSGRAETGLTGDDNFHLKLSSDGSNWKEALIGYTASGAIRIDQFLLGRAAQANQGRIECDFAAPATLGAVFSDTSTAASATALAFRKNSTQIGAIQLTATGVSYATTSDYRVKTQIGPIHDATKRIMDLNPIRYVFKAEPDREHDGFFAHEVQQIVPDAVIGAKDAVDAEGAPQLQGFDGARLIPLIVAALQDALKRLQALEAK